VGVVASPSDVLFPLATLFVLLGLAAQVLRHAAGLGEVANDWLAMFVIAAVAFGGIFAGVLSDWNEGGEAVVVGGAVSASLAALACFAHLLQRFTRGPIGSTTFRWLVFAAASVVAALGWGALAGARSTGGDGRVDSWVLAPVVAAVMAMVFVAMLATRRLMGRRLQFGPLLLFLGQLLFGAGLVTTALGQILVGSALAMAGGGLVYTGASSATALAPAAAPPLVRARAEASGRSRPATGVKVRIPKGDAVRVSTFTEEGAPRDDRK